MRKIDHALLLARTGLRVFPLPPNAKFPPPTGWQKLATDVDRTVESMWASDPDANIGVATGQGLLVLDFDCAKNKPGLESLELMDLLGLLPDSFRVATPSGGRHVYMRVPPDFAYTVAAEQVIAGIRLSPLPDFPGVDVRCNGGYVVGPGSVTKEGAYVAL